MKYLDLPTVTLACVDSINHVAALVALRASMVRCRFRRVLWVTNDLPSGLDVSGIDIIRFPHLTSDAAYSHFLFRELLTHVHTRHVLVQQWDGFVADNAAWDDQFLKYDYIGALAEIARPSGRSSCRQRRLFVAFTAIVGSFGRSDVATLSSRGCRHRRHLSALAGTGQRHYVCPSGIGRCFSYEGTAPKPTFGFHGMQALSGRLSPEELARLLRVLPLKTRRGGGSRVAVRSYFYRYGNFGKAQQLLAAMLANPHDYEPDDFIALTLGNSLLRLGRSSEAGAWWQNQLGKIPQPNQWRIPTTATMRGPVGR